MKVIFCFERQHAMVNLYYTIVIYNVGFVKKMHYNLDLLSFLLFETKFLYSYGFKIFFNNLNGSRCGGTLSIVLHRVSLL